MKKALGILVLGIVLLSLTGCFTFPFAATSNPVGSKMGEAKLTTIFSIPLPGDAGIYAAAKNGGISKISTVDIKYSWWVIGSTITTIVSGD
jgi:hypothetical protein